MELSNQQKRRHSRAMISDMLTRATYMGVLVLLLACVGAAVGATWVVDCEAKRLNTYDKINYR